VRHLPEYKLLVDTVRVAALTAEDHLAGRLRQYLAAETESKRALQNLFTGRGEYPGGEIPHHHRARPERKSRRASRN
jgi:hypothetical protein